MSVQSPLAGPLRSAGTAVRPAVLTVQEAAVYLSISVVTLYRLIRTGDIPHIRVGGSLRFRAADLDGYLDDNTSRTWKSTRGKEGKGVRKRKKTR